MIGEDEMTYLDDLKRGVSPRTELDGPIQVYLQVQERKNMCDLDARTGQQLDAPKYLGLLWHITVLQMGRSGYKMSTHIAPKSLLIESGEIIRNMFPTIWFDEALRDAMKLNYDGTAKDFRAGKIEDRDGNPVLKGAGIDEEDGHTFDIHFERADVNHKYNQRWQAFFHRRAKDDQKWTEAYFRLGEKDTPQLEKDIERTHPMGRDELVSPYCHHLMSPCELFPLIAPDVFPWGNDP
jgi:hypothetical protein